MTHLSAALVPSSTPFPNCNAAGKLAAADAKTAGLCSRLFNECYGAGRGPRVVFACMTVARGMLQSQAGAAEAPSKARRRWGQWMDSSGTLIATLHKPDAALPNSCTRAGGDAALGSSCRSTSVSALLPQLTSMAWACPACTPFIAQTCWRRCSTLWWRCLQSCATCTGGHAAQLRKTVREVRQQPTKELVCLLG